MAARSTTEAGPLDDAAFDALRAEVLASWPTGRDVDFDEAVAYHRAAPPHRNTATARATARATGRVLMQPLAGTGHAQAHLDLLTHLKEVGTADILPSQIDSLTRNLRFDDVGAILARGADGPRLNGYPIVNHGVGTARWIAESLDAPIEMRIGTTDARLAAEIAFAGGLTSMTAGPIYYTVHYSSAVPLRAGIRLWQYIFRLIGRYQENGVPLGLQIHGAGNTGPFPHGILGACSVLECLLAAEQGARNMSVNVRCMGNLTQDVVAAGVIPEVCRDYVTAAGYADCRVTAASKSWSGRHPDSTSRVFGILGYCAVIGMLGGVEEFITHSVEEGIGIPSAEANAASLLAMRQVIEMMKPQRVTLGGDFAAEEAAMLRAEIRALVDAVLEAGDGDVAEGVAAAFDAGLLDVPFAASGGCQGRPLVVRDDEGAVRYLDFGGLPVPAEVRAYNDARLAPRRARLGRDLGYDDVVADLFAVSNGRLVAGPP